MPAADYHVLPLSVAQQHKQEAPGSTEGIDKKGIQANLSSWLSLF
jgi:hypothetical protein